MIADTKIFVDWAKDYNKVDRGAVDISNRFETAVSEAGERRYRRRIRSGMTDFWYTVTRGCVLLPYSLGRGAIDPA